MSHFLFKPHIEGPKGLITTPDVIIDRLFVSVDSDLTPTSTSLLTSAYSQQSSKSERVAPLYALTSLGAGIIISPGATLSNGPINIARKGWRLNNLAGHTEGIMLNDTALTDLSTPEILINQIGGCGDRMPRGLMVVCLGSWRQANKEFVVKLVDPTLSRALKHQIIFEDVTIDRWKSRPVPRYSIGPTRREIKHYI